MALNLSFFFAVCFFLSIHMTCFCNNFSSLFLVFSLVKCSTILEITSEIFGKFSRIYWQLNSFLTEEQNIRQQFNLKRAPPLLSFNKIFSRIFKNSCSGQHLKQLLNRNLLTMWGICSKSKMKTLERSGVKYRDLSEVG